MNPFIIPLQRELEISADPVRAEKQRKYLKGQFEFFGIGAGQLRKIVKEFFCTYGYPQGEKLQEFSLVLWDLPQREYQQVVVVLLDKVADKLGKKDIDWIVQLIVKKSWWDTVDGLASWVCGTYFKNYPEQIVPVTEEWINSGNIWLQRSSLLFQLKYKKETDTKLLTSYIEQLIAQKEFFIRKAIGWVLREYSKTNPEWVRNFVQGHNLSGLSYREAVKYI